VPKPACPEPAKQQKLRGQKNMGSLKGVILLGGLLLLAGAAFAEESVVPAVTPVAAGDALNQEQVLPEQVGVQPYPSPFDDEATEEEESKTWAVLAGFFMGGGALVGVDLEVLAYDCLALQAGAGYEAYGAAVNYHFEPTLHSNYVSLAYWHQGFSPDLSQQSVGLTFGIRSFGWLTAQIGLGYVIHRGETATSNLQSAFDTDTLSQYMLLYSIGAYF
jgi:hypothetical protein